MYGGAWQWKYRPSVSLGDFLSVGIYIYDFFSDGRRGQVSKRQAHLCLPIAGHDDSQGREVEKSKELLGQEDVGALVGEVVEAREDVDVGGRIDQRAGSAADLGVVALARYVLRDLLHVGYPVDLGVWTGNNASLTGL